MYTKINANNTDVVVRAPPLVVELKLAVDVVVVALMVVVVVVIAAAPVVVEAVLVVDVLEPAV